MKKLTAAALLLCLLAFAASAQALPMTFSLGSGGYSAQLTWDYAPLGPGSGLTTLTVQNTSTLASDLNGIAFNLPFNGVGIATVSLQGVTNANFHLLSPAAPFVPNTCIGSPPRTYDVGLGTGPDNNHPRGAYGLGILNGQVATFSLLLSGSGPIFSLTDMDSVIAALMADPGSGNIGVALFTPAPAPTPIPGAVWLLGSGVLGLVGFKRRRKAA